MADGLATIEDSSRARRTVSALASRYQGLAGRALMAAMIEREFAGRIALVSSFGAESAVLLHLAASIDRSLPVLFLETGKHFPETLAYRDALIARLRLNGVVDLRPAAPPLAKEDPEGYLHLADPDRCCELRKVLPLAPALAPFAAWISGRKRYQAATRGTLPSIESDATHVKINPIASWGPDDIARYMAEHDLPAHPLVAKGYPSIGCAPCTEPVAAGEDARAGRWRGKGKVECGIHAVGVPVVLESDGAGI
ncbi:MAG: phosphoadenylyl-sulfate reductase [Hyphomicrobiaceae bacterium]